MTTAPGALRHGAQVRQKRRNAARDRIKSAEFMIELHHRLAMMRQQREESLSFLMSPHGYGIEPTPAHDARSFLTRVAESIASVWIGGRL